MGNLERRQGRSSLKTIVLFICRIINLNVLHLGSIHLFTVSLYFQLYLIQSKSHPHTKKKESLCYLIS